MLKNPFQSWHRTISAVYQPHFCEKIHCPKGPCRTVKRISVSNQALHLTPRTVQLTAPLCVRTYGFSKTLIEKCQKIITQPFWKHSCPWRRLHVRCWLPGLGGLSSVTFSTKWVWWLWAEIQATELSEEPRQTAPTVNYSVIPSVMRHATVPRKQVSISVKKRWPVLCGLRLSVASCTSSWSECSSSSLHVRFVVGTVLFSFHYFKLNVTDMSNEL